MSNQCPVCGSFLVPFRPTSLASALNNPGRTVCPHERQHGHTVLKGKLIVVSALSPLSLEKEELQLEIDELKKPYSKDAEERLKDPLHYPNREFEEVLSREYGDSDVHCDLARRSFYLDHVPRFQHHYAVPREQRVEVLKFAGEQRKKFGY